VSRRTGTWWTLVLFLLVATATASGADLIEPWSPGFSDLELFVRAGSRGDDLGSFATAGFGLGGGVSVGVTLSEDNAGPARGGLVAMLSRALGSRTDVDLWVETGMSSSHPEAELGRLDWAVGTEWSYRAGSCVPYLRLSRLDAGAGDRFHGLLGLMVPAGAVELHLELSSEEPDGGPWPVHLAIGPNFLLRPEVEVQPELSIIRDRGTGETTWVVTVGMVVDPAALMQHDPGW